MYTFHQILHCMHGSISCFVTRQALSCQSLFYCQRLQKWMCKVCCAESPVLKFSKQTYDTSYPYRLSLRNVWTWQSILGLTLIIQSELTDCGCSVTWLITHISLQRFLPDGQELKGKELDNNILKSQSKHLHFWCDKSLLIYQSFMPMADIYFKSWTLFWFAAQTIYKMLIVKMEIWSWV